MNYLRFINKLSQARKRSPIRLMTEILYKSPPSIISMASGMPNASQFPFQEATFKLKDGTSIEINSTDIKQALQYNPTPGVPAFNLWLKDLIHQLHKPSNMALPEGEEKTELLVTTGSQQGLCMLHNPSNMALPEGEEKTELLVTTGSQQGLCMTLEMLLRQGDKVLVSSPIYAGTRSILDPYHPEYVIVESDKDGLNPESLWNNLQRWNKEDVNDEKSDIPKILYTVPNGDNPSGASISEDRRREIYSICQDYNLLILEDDPYYFLQFNKPRLPSFLSLDVDSRVIRFDSFSKVLSAGLRLGCISGPKALLFPVQLHMEASLLHTSAVSQMIVLKLMEEWGVNGFLAHSEKVAAFYKQRRDTMIKAADKWLTGLAEWNVPIAGMFLWMKLPGIKDTKDLIMRKAIEKEVLFMPGDAFTLSEEPSQYMRACFSMCSDEEMDEGMRRLGALIREEQG